MFAAKLYMGKVEISTTYGRRRHQLVLMPIRNPNNDFKQDQSQFLKASSCKKGLTISVEAIYWFSGTV